jgi:two-component system CheB/CheR fusion protein
LRYPNLLADVRSVLETLTRIDKEIEGADGDWYHMKIVPYRTAGNIIEGVVITFIDISFAEAVVETVRQPLLILDKNLMIIAANPAFYRHFQTRPEETVGVRVYELGNNQWDIPELRRLLEQILPENTKFEDFQVQAAFPEIGRRTLLLNARQTMHKGEATGRILVAFEDITGQTKDAGQMTDDGSTRGIVKSLA